MRDMVYCEKCNEYVGYKREWSLEKDCCNKCTEDKIAIDYPKQEQISTSNCIDKGKLIRFLEARMGSLGDRISRDFGGGMIDDQGKFNEAKMIKEAALRGEFDIDVW